MGPIDPNSAHPFALDRLTDDEWEELTFLLAWGEDRRVERLRAPDGGLDTVLPRPARSGEAERGWQPKHYPGPKIHWDKCEESLDRAVELWKVTRVTFTFPRDLSRDERVKFHEKLEARHIGVTVDFWSGSEIQARLSADEAGERASRRFFGHHDAIEVMERAMRAGGPLSTGEHAVDRELQSTSSFRLKIRFSTGRSTSISRGSRNLRGRRERLCVSSSARKNTASTPTRSRAAPVR